MQNVLSGVNAVAAPHLSSAASTAGSAGLGWPSRWWQPEPCPCGAVCTESVGRGPSVAGVCGSRGLRSWISGCHCLYGGCLPEGKGVGEGSASWCCNLGRRGNGGLSTSGPAGFSLWRWRLWSLRGQARSRCTCSASVPGGRSGGLLCQTQEASPSRPAPAKVLVSAPMPGALSAHLAWPLTAFSMRPWVWTGPLLLSTLPSAFVLAQQVASPELRHCPCWRHLPLALLQGPAAEPPPVSVDGTPAPISLKIWNAS